MPITRNLLLCSLTGLIAAGCASHASQSAAPTTMASAATQPGAQNDPTIAVRTRLTDVQAQVADLAAQWGALPGETDEHHRRLMASTFASLEQILPALLGTPHTRGFDQEMAIIEDARQQLVDGSRDLSSDPSVESGLRAAYRALQELNKITFVNQDPLTQEIDAIRLRIVEMDEAHGAEHRVVARQTVQQITDVMAQMAEILLTRIGVEPASQPAASTAQ